MGALDLRVVWFMAAHRFPFLTHLFETVGSVGSRSLILEILLAIGGVFVVLARRWRLAIAVAASFVVGTYLSIVLKSMINRPRPPAALTLVHLGGSAMPSTHAAGTAAAATAALLCLDWLRSSARAAVGAVLAAALGAIGLSMIYLGGHWLSDVLAGWLVGAVVGATITFALRWVPNGRGARGHTHLA
jgi:membrane-associated phospholipid phosphatase